MFEGSEKKIEIIFSQDSPSLLKKALSFWKEIIQACGAEIVSYSKFPKVHSYILSESSLFVWDHRLVLITCGKTSLARSLIQILKSFPKNHIELCFFQRKNELFPEDQTSRFHTDIQKIEQNIEGRSYRFGSLHAHHFFLFHSLMNSKPNHQDQTLEILIYDSESFRDSSPQTIKKLKKEFEKIFFNFEIQEHFFNPLGYSLNAVKDIFYYTLHITPEKTFFYISFETNITEKSIQDLTGEILNIFKPGHFDFICFESQKTKKETFEFPNYFSSSSFYKKLDCGYDVSYKNFHKKNIKTQSPFLINKGKKNGKL